jgi:hypothetical protein
MNKNIFDGIEEKFPDLLSKGYIKLDNPISNFCDLGKIKKDITGQIDKKIYSTDNAIQTELLSKLGVFNCLTPKLYDLARNFFNYKGSMNDQYHVMRLVKTSNIFENYRAHFDSHIFTLVLPIHIPKYDSGSENGELLYFPKARIQPKSELENFIGKFYFKKFASRSGVESLAKTQEVNVELFEDMKPLIFVGNTTFHTNRALQGNSDKFRLTFLSHFFDPSPTWGVGNILRVLRNR